jgi:cytochrome b subunit of formate dehydrogenase
LWIVLIPFGVQAEEMVCSDCHEGQPDAATFADSVHGFLGCADCHTGAEAFPHEEGVATVDCAMCHDQEVEAYTSSIHGVGHDAGEVEAPWCESCHGGIHTLVPSSDPESPVHPSALAETCGTCHSDPEMVKKYGIPVAKPIEAYEASVHAKHTDEGAANCSSCHGSHAIYDASDPRSTVFHLNVPDTCGQCHGQIAEVFSRSVHGTAVQHGVREAPVCTDCHGEHRILGPDEEGSPVFATNVPKMTCGRCHGNVRLAEKYDIAASAVEAYQDSYHGLASRAGNATVAHCGSCHGVHDILPSSDPASHINPANLAETCGTCHPGAGQKYAIGKVHVLPTEREHAAVYWIREIYLWMIFLTIGGMLLHNGLDLFRKVRQPQTLPPPGSLPSRERMALGFRIAHVCMAVSFIVLAYTGFALKFPESWWAAPLLTWEESFGFRGFLHRGAALLMLFALGLHLMHLAVDRRARGCILKMTPTLHDLHEFRDRLLWMIGKRPDPPKSPTLGYPEKAEYLALMWGILVMTVTGFMLWFENPMLRLAPKWFGDVATVIHFYEAVLATLAILVWHFYFVIFDPVIYPMDFAWLTGKESPGRTAEREEEEDDDSSISRPAPVAQPRAVRGSVGKKQPAV